MAKSTGAIDIIRTNFRLSANSQNHSRSISWATRIISGIAQGVGLLALIQLANTWASRQEETANNANPWILTLLVTAIIGAISIYIRDRFSYEGAFSVMRSVHRRVGNQLAKLPLGWFSTDTTGRLSRLGAATVNELGNLSAHLLTELSAATVTLLTLLAGLLWWYPILGSIFALCLICYLILMWALTYLDSAASAYAAPAATELADRIVEFSTCQSMLRACDQTIYPQMATALAENRRRSTRRLWVECIGNFLGGIASQTICVVMIISSVHLAFTGSLAPLAVVAVIGISLEITHYLSTISNCRTGLLAVGPTMATINEVLDARPLPEPETSLPQPLPHQVELREVDFAYGNDKQVLNKVSFTVAPHTMTALVGPSGAGKTTIARLICRFWDVNSGAVLVGDRDVRELTTEDLMSQISMVFQDVYLFDDTLEANIRIGNSNAPKEALLRAAELAGVNDIVSRLPDGWDTKVGEGGCALSGGERQRVSIARAILKNAPIVLFDEATSALDAENEANLLRSFEVLRRQSTMLVIAHKLHTITQADQIVVLDDHGHVAQIGTHNQLISCQGIYRDFWNERQAASGWKIAAH